MPRPPSRADHDLAARCRAEGVRADAGLIQAFREVGLLVAPQPCYPGGGGSEGQHRDGAVDQVREALALDTAHPRQRWANVIRMWARGTFEVSEGKLKRALRRGWDLVEDEMYAIAGDDAADDRVEVALEVGPVIARRLARDPEANELRRRFKRGAEPREAVLASAASNVASLFLSGNLLSDDAFGELLVMAGLGPLFTDPYAQGRPLIEELPDPSQFRRDFEAAQLDTIRTAIETASIAELDGARDDWKDLLRYAALACEVFPRTTGSQQAHGFAALLEHAGDDLAVALGAVAMLVQRQLFPDEMDAVVQQFRRELPRIRALAHLLDVLPEKFHRLAGPDGDVYAARLSARDHRELDEYKAEFARRYPLDVPLLA